MTVSKAVKRIEKRGILLVFPLNNRPEPASLWSEFFPKSEMRWEWDSGGDDRVPELWHLREELSRSKKVVYTKWYKGRATFFSKEAFVAAVAYLGGPEKLERSLSFASHSILQILREESPLSTKQLKKRTKLEGRVHEGAYTKAMKELWARLLIVGFGEVEDGAFPSLAVGATELLFEGLYREAEKVSENLGKKRLETLVGDTLFWKDLEKLKTTFSHDKEKSKSRHPKVIKGEELALFTNSKRWER
jgi:hypothetical protein